MVSTTQIPVRGYHLDVYGHVNNARYLEFLEEARWVLFEEHFDAVAWRKKGLAFLVANININYRRPATIGDMLEIRTFVSRFGKKSATFTQNVVLDSTEALVADAEITFVLADIATGKAVPIEGELRDLFQPFCEAAACEPDGDARSSG